MDASEISTTDFSIFLRLFEEVSVFNLHDVLGLNSECIWPFLSRVIKSARCERVDFIGCYISNEPGDDLFNPLEHIMDIPQRRVSLDFTDSPATSVTTQHIIDYAKSWVDSEFPLVFETIRLHYRFGEQALDLSQFCRLHCSLCRWNGNFGEQYHVHSFTHRKYKSLIINIDQDESSILLGCYMKVCSHNLNIQHDDTGRFKISSDGRVALHARTVSRHDAIYADRQETFARRFQRNRASSGEMGPRRIGDSVYPQGDHKRGIRMDRTVPWHGETLPLGVVCESIVPHELVSTSLKFQILLY
ncbi:hypothetical protein L596_011269 [Steinernema carpocapsae]|uniref:Uncharacterized protein n=1 Tax=Steinernema carpocapsae TaxID=34508 RepID=A0A4U5NU89_STECR|nr:hypothetical protein L596_011269 [Steinernema carpocapsae]